jgi:RNA polymerase sigma-70 factor (ECF subfamily)
VTLGSVDIKSAGARSNQVDPLPPTVAGPTNHAQASVEPLYLAQSARLHRFFARRSSVDDALDLVQEAFLRLIRIQRTTSEPIERPASYLSRIATNLMRDRARQQHRCSAATHVSFDENSHHASAPPDVLEESEALARLHGAVDRLRPRTREIFLLHRVEGLTYVQIAEEVGMSVKGVKKQMAKALFELRRDLGPL